MSPKMQEKLFLPEYSKELLEIAEGDLNTAIAIKDNPIARMENAFYMVQQSIEKGLKAVLVFRKIPVPLVHDLGILLAKLPSDLNPPFGYELNDLNQYASIRRYELGSFQLTVEEMEIVIEKGRMMLDWCKENILGAKQI
ncbi:MAG: HEPN domain-containing protein [Pseudobdellovibrionaceae bacterium]